MGKSSPARADARARLIDRVDEVRDHAQLQRLERPARDVERVECLGQRLAGAQRKQWMALEKLDRLGGRRLRGDDDLRIGGRLELRERCRAERRQRKRGDGVDDPIEFQSASGSMHVDEPRKHWNTETSWFSLSESSVDLRASVIPWPVRHR